MKKKSDNQKIIEREKKDIIRKAGSIKIKINLSPEDINNIIQDSYDEEFQKINFTY